MDDCYRYAKRSFNTKVWEKFETGIRIVSIREISFISHCAGLPHIYKDTQQDSIVPAHGI